MLNISYLRRILMPSFFWVPCQIARVSFFSVYIYDYTYYYLTTKVNRIVFLSTNEYTWRMHFSGSRIDFHSFFNIICTLPIRNSGYPTLTFTGHYHLGICFMNVCLDDCIVHVLCTGCKFTLSYFTISISRHAMLQLPKLEKHKFCGNENLQNICLIFYSTLF